jgi:ABC-type sugar transport system substrate-binding protein
MTRIKGGVNMTNTRKKVLLGGLGAIGASVLFASPSLAAKPGDGLTVCLSIDKMSSPSRDGQVKLWRQEADELGLKLIEQVAGEDAQRQSAQIDTCIAQGVAGIVDIPWDYEAVLQDIERAHAAGIPIVTMDQAPADSSTVDFHTGADPHADGLHAAQRLIAIVGDKPTKVVDLQGALSHFNGQGRDKGFKDGIKDHPNIKIVAEVPTEWRPEPVLAGMENALQANPDIGAVFSASDGLLPPVWSALKKANRYTKAGEPNHVVVLSVDGDPQGCQSVRDGVMDAGYAQPFTTMTRATLQAIIDFKKNGKKYDEKDRVLLVPGTEYTPTNFDATKDKVWGCAK